MIGIYKIVSLCDNKIYIGKSINISERRSTHFKLLRKNIHDNRHLQNAYNKYAKENFSFEVIEECSIDELPIKESFYINLYQTNNQDLGYNMYIEENGFVKHSAETIALMRSVKPCKPVFGFDLQGNLVKQWDSIKMCAKEIDANPNDVRRTIAKKQITCKGLVLNSENIFRMRKAKPRGNSVTTVQNCVLR